MDISPIRNAADHDSALREIERLWDAADGTPDGDKLDILVTLVEAYERQRWPIQASDPVEIIKFIMEQRDATQADLAALLGSASRASEILRRRRPLTLQMIWRLHEAWGIPAELLIRPYATSAA